MGYPPQIILSQGTSVQARPVDPADQPHTDADYLIPPSAIAGQAINVLDKQYGAKGNGQPGDGAAVNQAIAQASALSTAGQYVDVVLPSGFEFQLEQITPMSGVRLVCDGACIIPNWSSIGNAGLIRGTGVLNRWAIRGGTWQGSGAETVNQILFIMASGGSGVGWRFQDMTVTNWATIPLYLRNVAQLRVLDNDFLNVNNGAFGSWFNCINIVGDTSAAQALQDIIVRGNLVTGTKGAAIAMVLSQVGNFDMKTLIDGNTCVGDPGGTSISGSIDLEITGSGNTYRGIKIANNDCEYTATATVNNGPLQITNAEFIGTQVTGNRFKSTASGMFINSPDTVLTGNHVESALPPVGATGAIYAAITMSGNDFAGGPVSGVATLVAGAATVNTPEIGAHDNVLLSVVTHGGGAGEVGLNGITAGVSFNILNSNNASTDTVYWRIDH